MNTSKNNSQINQNILNYNNIKYIFIGNAINNKDIGEMPSFANLNYKEKSIKIFEKYCNIDSRKEIEKRNKINSENGIYYTLISSSNIFYLILTTNNYPEKRVYEMLEDLKKDNIHLLVDEKGELNEPGKQALRDILIEYDNNEKDFITDINLNINEMKIEMENNIRRVITNTDTLNSLDDKAVKIKENANLFKKDSTTLRKKTWCQNIKWTIVLILIIVLLLLVVIVPIIVRK